MAKAKSTFVKFLGSAHLNFTNIALYSSGSVRVENVVNGKSLAAKQFASVEAAEEWFDSFDGNNTTRLHAAMQSMGVN